MPIFEYRGLNKAGKNIKGTIDAENMRMARLKLKKDKIYVVDLKDKTKAKKKARGKNTYQTGKVNVQDMSMMTRQLATLIRSNVPLVDSLSAVSEQSENPILKEALSDVKNMVNEGSTLYRALGRYPKLFDKIYISMCEAGEMSGTLDTILIRLAEFTEARNELQAKIRSAMMYPMIMMLFAVLMMFFLFIYVVPKIMIVFDSFELTMPWYSQLIIDTSGLMVNYWYLIVIMMLSIWLIFKHWKGTPAGREQWDAIILKIPIVGPLARMIAVSRFTRTLSTLLTGGVPMLTAMDIVRNVVDNAVLASAVESARDNISEGESIAGPLRKSGQFPPVVLHMISIGEKTGDLENMLTQVSDSFDFMVNTKVDGLTSILSPIMMVVMGGVIAFIVVGIMVPLLEISNIG